MENEEKKVNITEEIEQVQLEEKKEELKAIPESNKTIVTIKKPKKSFLLPLLLMVGLIVAGAAIFSPILFQKYDTIKLDKEYESVIGKQNVYEYYYSTLEDENEQILYKELKIAAETYKKRFTTQVEVTEEMAAKVFPLVVYDHPELFWLYSYTLNIGDKFTYFTMSYSYDESAISEKMAEMKETYQPIIDEAKKLETDIEKINYVYSKLIETGEYSEFFSRDREGFQSIVSIFTEHKTVCTGYTYGFKFIMDKLGIESISIPDKEKLGTKESHIWNAVKVGETEWRYLDLTWRQPISNKNAFYGYLGHKIQDNLPN